MTRPTLALALALLLAAAPARAGIGELDPLSNGDLGLAAGAVVGALAGGLLLANSFYLLRELHETGTTDPGRFVPLLGLGAGSLLLASGFLVDQLRTADRQHPWGAVGASAWVVASLGFVALGGVGMHAWLHAPVTVVPTVVPTHDGHASAALSVAGRF